MYRVRFLLATLSIPLVVGLFGSVQPAPATSTVKNELCAGAGTVTGGSATCGDNGAAFTQAVAVIINLLSAIIGVIAVVMIIIAGARFITSGGDSGKVAGAKNAVIYAIIGLIVVALAQFIVHFVINTVAK